MDIKKRAQNKIRRAIRSRKLIPSSICTRCKKRKKTDGHHPDYNKPLEVIWLCRSCHMIEDGRMDLIHAKGIHVTDLKKCKICGEFAKPLRRGRCHKCNEFFRRNNFERPYKNKDGRKERTIALHKLLCKRCGRVSNIVGNPIKGYCKSCYTYFNRKRGGRNDLYNSMD